MRCSEPPGRVDFVWHVVLRKFLGRGFWLGIAVDLLQCFSPKCLLVFTKFIWVPLAFCILLTTVSEQPAADKRINVLWKELGLGAVAYL